MSRKIVWAAVIVAAIVAFAARIATRGQSTPARSIEQVHADEGVPVDVVVVRRGSIAVVREITGVVSGIRQSVLRAADDQKIAEVAVREGAAVRRGDTLVRFDVVVSPDRMARVAQAREVYANARRQVERLEPLFDEGAVAESELDAARTAFSIAAADLRNARLELEVVAPITGVATLVAVRRGDAVEAGDVLVQIAVLDSVRIEADVSGESAREVRAGAPVYVAPARGGSAIEAGRVTRVAMGANPDTRLFRVEATLDNAALDLRPGLVVTMEVVVDRADTVLVVPETAVLASGELRAAGRCEVFAVSEGAARRATVTVGHVADGVFEARAG
ncbi:MAG: efflux RND transporter periplasmic adaptor subunit, partial [Candidatus Krumholzibacteria bacterium]|nr:efflux RND transporter periplasmic adaptor subunit [Candidatus Krumholzibacteria bacterium]